MLSRTQWYTPLIPALKRLKQEDHEFEASLGYKARFEDCLGYSDSILKNKQTKSERK
jgi:hypothetical protein